MTDSIIPQIKPSQHPDPWRDKVKVLSMHRTDQAGTIKGFASIQIGAALEIRDLKLIQQPGQKLWVALPDRIRSDAKGYAPIVRALDPRLKSEIDRVVLDAWTQGTEGGDE